MECVICKHEKKEVFKGRLLNKYDVSYFSCSNCRHLSTEKPYWLEEAYQNPINASDTGLLGRNIYLSKIVSILCLALEVRGDCIDHAGGYGTFTRLMRDVGFDFFWFDEYASNLFAQGFELKDSKTTKFDLLTSFETLEHFEDPIKALKDMLSYSDNVLITTSLFDPDQIPKFQDWWYYGEEHGQHISFFNVITLNRLARDLGVILYTNKQDLHFFTRRKGGLKLKVLFFIFGTQVWSRLLREFLFILIKSKMKGKTFEDMNVLKNRR